MSAESFKNQNGQSPVAGNNKSDGYFARRGGVLLSVSSLPSPHGIGTFGASAYRFIDGLAEVGASIWAILPLGQTGYGDSPYQCVSGCALNPYFLDLDKLTDEGLLTAEECAGVDYSGDCVDYGRLYQTRYPLLMTAYARAKQQDGYDEQINQFWHSEPWVDEYALFMAIKDSEDGRPWYEWADEGLRRCDHNAIAKQYLRLECEVGFYIFLQFKLYSQWNELHAYAKEHGVKIMGDAPIYCAYDSVECWTHPSEFQLDDALQPVFVAGVPPDYFCADGQLWGNPLYDWGAMKKNGYAFWLNRICHASKLYDILRIDHFRGFESCYAIPYGETTARNGVWQRANGFELFRKAAELKLPLEIVAEDLGFITPNVKRLLTKTGFAGMKVAEFAFDGEKSNPHFPKKWDGRPQSVVNKVIYTGTHDNPPLAEWLAETDDKTIDVLSRFLSKKDFDCADIVKAVLDSDAKYAIIPMQDVLGLGADARMNTPSVPTGNWVWRMKAADLNFSTCRFDFSRQVTDI